MVREFIAGNNFSGRSEALRSALQRRQVPAFFLGPYAEAALSGLSSTVADEIAIYARAPQHGCFASIDWTRLGNRKPATLSGGEQVSLALHCFSRSAYPLIGIDTALEQLDAQNRASALAYLSAPHSFDTILIDNRLAHVPPGWRRQDARATTTDYGCDLAGLLSELRPREVPVITIRAMDFSYEPARPIFRNVDLSLKPGKAYRLVGPNGAGKSTFFKILVGVLAPARGTILLNDMPYRPGAAAIACSRSPRRTRIINGAGPRSLKTSRAGTGRSPPAAKSCRRRTHCSPRWRASSAFATSTSFSTSSRWQRANA